MKGSGCKRDGKNPFKGSCADQLQDQVIQHLFDAHKEDFPHSGDWECAEVMEMRSTVTTMLWTEKGDDHDNDRNKSRSRSRSPKAPSQPYGQAGDEWESEEVEVPPTAEQMVQDAVDQRECGGQKKRDVKKKDSVQAPKKSKRI